MLRIDGRGRSYRMVPGELRSQSNQDNAVGRHQPPSSLRVATFMEYFERKYAFARLGSAGRLIAIPLRITVSTSFTPSPTGTGVSAA